MFNVQCLGFEEKSYPLNLIPKSSWPPIFVLIPMPQGGTTKDENPPLPPFDKGGG